MLRSVIMMRPCVSEGLGLGRAPASSLLRCCTRPARSQGGAGLRGVQNRAIPEARPVVTAEYLQRAQQSADTTATLRARGQANMEAAIAAFRSSASSSSKARSDVASASANGGSASSLALGTLRDKLKNAISVMQHGLVERDTEVRLLLLAAMSGEHILLIGPPGTAKSEVGRRLNKLISGTYFERLLTRFSVPEELFGPLSMRALEQDKYERQTTGYLPEAEIAFIDEIFKANSAILNSLLTIINERQFDNGAHRVDVPLISVVGASNELPESEELDALYDRFLVRRAVRQVSATGVGQMLSFYSNADEGPQASSSSSSNGNGAAAPAAAGSMLLSRDDILRCKKEALRTVTVPPSIIQMVTDLRSFLQDRMEPKVYVSDRRLVKSVQLLQVAAYCNGRTTVSEYDVLLLQHVLWQRPEQAVRINDWIMSQLSVDDGVKQVEYLLKGLFTRACSSLGDKAKAEVLQQEAVSLRSVLADKYSAIAANMDGDRFQENLWMGPEEAEAIANVLEPQLRKTSSAVQTVLLDVSLLEAALESNQSSPVALANLMPRYWADFIRSSNMSDVKPIGTTPMSSFKGTTP